jgi:uncharacterized BrkB/YihY/UPF0761 family membrane protein
MAGQEPRRRRREQLEAMLAGGQARLERARSRSLVVDTMVGVVRRERPVAAAILAASLAFRLFALLVPLSYLVVAGLGFAGPDSVDAARPGAGNHLGDLVLSSVAAAARSSQRARWLALIFGGVATLLAAAAVLEVLRWVHLLAWRMAPARSRPNPWLVLGLLGGLTVVSVASTIAEQARADAKGLAGELTVVLVSAGVQVLVLAVLWLALSWAMPRPARVPWTALVPGAFLFAAGFQGFSLAVGLYFAPRAARASTVYGSLGVALTLLVSLFLFARLAVAAAELNATLWERRRPVGKTGDPSGTIG